MFESLTGAELAAALDAAGPATGDAAGPAGRGDPAGPAGTGDPTDPTDSAGAGGSAGLAGVGLGDLVDRVAACDRLIGWATGRQARAVAALAAGYEAHYLADLPAAATAGYRSDVRAEAVKDTAVELGLARITGINAAGNLLRFADELVTDHPDLLNLLEAGEVPSWNIGAVLAETRVLPSSLRRQADAELASQLPGMSWSEATQAAARQVIDLDPDAANQRAETARAERSVSARPGRDSMGWLSAHLPAEQTRACWAALDDHARGLKADGDPRSLRHLMCETLVERVTGLSAVDQLPVRVDVAVCASTLAGADDHPGQLRGYGPIPAPVLADLLAGPDVVLRRLVTDPVDDHVLTVDSKQRFYRGELRDLILTTDPVCVVPGCDRPATQADHVVRHADGGATSAANALGVCTRHNLAHEQPGHRLHVSGGATNRGATNGGATNRGATDGGATDSGGGDGQAGRDQVFWITLARKVYKLIHPPGPRTRRHPQTPTTRPPPTTPTTHAAISAE